MTETDILGMVRRFPPLLPSFSPIFISTLLYVYYLKIRFNKNTHYISVKQIKMLFMLSMLKIKAIILSKVTGRKSCYLRLGIDEIQICIATILDNASVT